MPDDSNNNLMFFNSFFFPRKKGVELTNLIIVLKDVSMLHFVPFAQYRKS